MTNYVIGKPGASPRFIMQGNLQTAQAQVKDEEVCFEQATIPEPPYKISVNGTVLVAVALDPAVALARAWDEVRMIRDGKLNVNAWTINRPNALSATCRAAWEAWFAAMDRLTLDFTAPEDVIWPDEPPLAYA